MGFGNDALLTAGELLAPISQGKDRLSFLFLAPRNTAAGCFGANPHSDDINESSSFPIRFALDGNLVCSGAPSTGGDLLLASILV